MEFFKKLLGIKSLEKQISQNKAEIKKLKLVTKSEQTEKYKAKTLQILKTPTSTTQLSQKLKISRSRASQILNQLEKLGKIIEHSKSGRTILYKTK